MKHTFRAFSILAILALLFATFGFSAQPAKADPAYVCLPTCEANDGRFFNVAGMGLETLADESINLQLAAPWDATNIEIGIFDGNTGGMWDSGTTILKYELYADPLVDGSQSFLVAQWLGSEMPDNAWFNVTLPNVQEAKAPNGNFFYHLYIYTTDPGTTYVGNFKARTDGYMFTVRPSTFAFTAPLTNFNDIQVIYPNWPSLTPTTYDGNFDFYLYLPSSASFLSQWDGDLDYGSYDLLNIDTDDLDTPNNTLPEWAKPEGNNLEGVNQADPQDDNNLQFYRRSPNIYYEVTTPDGQSFTNTDPSGNQEWEQFRIETNPSIPADYYVDSPLPSGIYHITLHGMDMSNLNAWHFFHSMVGVCPAPPEGIPDPCKEIIHPYTIGDTIFHDSNGNGFQDYDEVGISGVVVYLLDGNNQPIRDIHGNPISTTTGSDGTYSFDVDGQSINPNTNEIISDGVYTIQVDQANFNPGAPLAGMTSTTGGELQTNTVIDANILTYDFGYHREFTNPGTGTIGFWKTHPEAWPVETIIMGGQTYTREQAIALMNAKKGGDKTYDLFAQLVAAKLNVLIGNDPSCISADIQTADAWLATYPLGSKVKASSPAWQAISATFTRLDNYNNGLLCAPHRG